MAALGIDHKSGSSREIVAYLEQYYRAGAGEIEIFGALCSELGLDRYESRQFMELLEGRLPDGTRMRGQGSKRRKMTDLTFSAPKSVSALALTGDPRLREAHRKAVRAALVELEMRAASARYGKAGAQRVYTRSLTAALFEHEDARPVNGITSPQLHTHCAVLNVTRHGGQWRGLDLELGAAFDMGRFVESVYLSRLARETEWLGYRVRETKDGFEIEGVTRAQIEALSLREAQVIEAMQAAGVQGLTGQARSRFVLGSREDKLHLPVDEMRRQFRELVRAAGIEPERVVEQARERRAEGQHKRDDEQRLQSAWEAVTHALDHLGERDSVFTERALLVDAMRAGRADGISPQELESVFVHLESDGEIIRREGLVTTRAMIQAEANCIRVVEDGKGQYAALLEARAAEQKIRALNSVARERSGGQHQLTAGQEDAIRLGLTSRDRVFAVRGAAGTGKTSSAIQALADEAKAQGIEVVALAPTGEAAAGLQAIGTGGADTITGHLLKDKGGQGDRLYIVDEAGMIGTRDMEALLKKVEAENARIMLVGDQRQLQAVAAGNAFEQLQEQTSMATADLAQIIRQKDHRQREMVESFAKGDSAKAAEILMGYITRVRFPQSRNTDQDKEIRLSKKERADMADQALAEAVADAYLNKSPDVQAETLVVAATNRVRRRINERIRDSAINTGEIDREQEECITALDRDSGMTRTRMGRATHYREGHRIIGELKARGHDGKPRPLDVTVLNSLDRYRLSVIDNKTGMERVIHLKDDVELSKLRAYTQRELSLAPGDRMFFREAAKIGEQKVNNKTRARVEEIIDGKITLTTDTGKTLELDQSKPVALDYGWAVTVHASQGATRRCSLWAATGSKAESANLAYVGASRQTDEIQIFSTDPAKVEASVKKWSRSIDAHTLMTGYFTAEKRQATEELKRAHEIERMSMPDPERKPDENGRSKSDQPIPSRSRMDQRSRIAR